ncbi:oxidoreductase-like domain-containing protein [Bordetella petrii]|uniref:oxidoreductase-like domain-containing protein n=1 Tax=Bordetella petrii TaxID=94624 RepID=UPI001E598458|nr:oxidoreductase-like domain-containing protein [Bordetella petrii]MCD0506142.1 oxidoreductase-like domain-containing protein [Bordetella petrii]
MPRDKKTEPAPAAHDPEPLPPERPGPGDCCGSGCIPCVYDLYDDAMDRYHEQLRAWKQRNGLAP